MSVKTSSESPEVILITGANRGIGRGLVEHYLERPKVHVLACVRSISHPTSTNLQTIRHHPTSSLTIYELDASSPTDASDVISTLANSTPPITHIDTIISCAAISIDFARVRDMDVTAFQRQLETNTFGPLRLFQAARLLLKNAQHPKFVVCGSRTATLTGMATVPYPIASYGVSKTAVAYLVRKIHFEEDWLVAFVLNPGYVATDMAEVTRQPLGVPDGLDPVPVAAVVKGMVEQINGATKESGSDVVGENVVGLTAKQRVLQKSSESSMKILVVLDRRR